MLRVIAGLTLIAVLTAGWWWSKGQNSAAPERSATTVNVVPAISRALSDTLEVVGTARATRAIILVTQVDGRVERIHFRESEEVNAGDLLVTLDDRAARAETDRTRADYQRALSDYQRAARLVGGGAISEAEVANLKTVMESARATMEASRVALEDHYLRAPFDGVVGLRQADEGAFLQVGAPITTLDSVRNLEVNFQVPERYLSDIRPDLTVKATSEAYPGKVFQGKIAMLDSRVDAASRSLTVKALLDNADSLLRPGQFLQVSVLLAEHPALLVPEQAVISQGAQSYVFTVNNGDIAERLPVSLGDRRDGWVEVTAGLDRGQPVIVNGHSRLGSGAPVKVVEDEGALMPSQRALLEEAA